MPVTFVKNVGSTIVSMGTSAAVTVPASGVPIGDLIVLRTCVNTNTTQSVADSKGNTWTDTVGSVTASGGVTYSSLFYTFVTVALVSGDTITTTYGASCSGGMVADQFSGLAGTMTATPGTGTGTSTTPSATETPSAAGELVYGSLAYNANTTMTVDSDTTQGSWSVALTAVIVANMYTRGQYKITTGASAQTWDPTIGTSASWVSILAAFPEASTGRSLVTMAPGLAVRRSANW